MMDKNKVGVALGLLFAIMHAVWSLTILIIPGQLQAFLNWVFNLHALVPIYTITAFNLVNMIILIVLTFVFGYIFGWVFAWCHNILHKK